jgi:hypothetical protein
MIGNVWLAPIHRLFEEDPDVYRLAVKRQKFVYESLRDGWCFVEKPPLPFVKKEVEKAPYTVKEV